jgi:hypothetical protein
MGDIFFGAENMFAVAQWRLTPSIHSSNTQHRCGLCQLATTSHWDFKTVRPISGEKDRKIPILSPPRKRQTSAIFPEFMKHSRRFANFPENFY